MSEHESGEEFYRRADNLIEREIESMTESIDQRARRAAEKGAKRIRAWIRSSVKTEEVSAFLEPIIAAEFADLLAENKRLDGENAELAKKVEGLEEDVSNYLELLDDAPAVTDFGANSGDATESTPLT